jgi:hypothetical protein
MDPFGAIFGLIGAGVNASNQAMSLAIAMENLRWQKEQARKQERFSQAARTDVYGNKQYYDYLANEWKVKLTPRQKAITTADERERLLSLTEDAQRNRQLRRRLAERSRDAEGQYYATLAGYKYDKPASEDAITHELAKLIAMAKSDSMRESAKPVAAQLLRTGKGALLPQLLRSQAQESGGTIGDTMLKARSQAVQEAASREQQHQSKYLPALQYFAQIMNDGGGNGNIMFTTLPQEKAQEQTAQNQLMMRALESAGTNVGNAYSAAAKAAGQQISFPSMGGGSRTAARSPLYAGLQQMRAQPQQQQYLWDISPAGVQQYLPAGFADGGFDSYTPSDWSIF